jgi:hypothetical protein
MLLVKNCFRCWAASAGGSLFFNFMFLYFNININVGAVMIQTGPPFPEKVAQFG